MKDARRPAARATETGCATTRLGDRGALGWCLGGRGPGVGRAGGASALERHGSRDRCRGCGDRRRGGVGMADKASGHGRRRLLRRCALACGLLALARSCSGVDPVCGARCCVARGLAGMPGCRSARLERRRRLRPGRGSLWPHPASQAWARSSCQFSRACVVAKGGACSGARPLSRLSMPAACRGALPTVEPRRCAQGRVRAGSRLEGERGGLAARAARRHLAREG